MTEGRQMRLDHWIAQHSLDEYTTEGDEDDE